MDGQAVIRVTESQIQFVSSNPRPLKEVPVVNEGGRYGAWRNVREAQIFGS